MSTLGNCLNVLRCRLPIVAVVVAVLLLLLPSSVVTAEPAMKSASLAVATRMLTDPASIVHGARSTDVCGAISTSRSWSLAGSPYVITCGLSVSAGATLTVQAGVVVKFSNSGSMQIDGALVTRGTASSPVVFTSLQDDSVGGDTNGDGTRTRPGAGEWYGLYVSRGGSATLAYTHVRYGGNSTSQMSSEGTLTVSNSTITSSATNGIEVYSGTARITSSTIRANNVTGIHVSGGTLTLGSSTVSQNQNHGIEASGNAILHLTSNTLSANPGQPIHLQYGVAQRPTLPTFTGNTMTGNGANAIGLSGTTGTLTLTPFAGLPFVIDQSLNVAAGSTLTLPAGLVLKFQQGSMSAHGRVVTRGTASSPVVFTSLQDDSVGGDTNGDGTRTRPGAGEWYGLYVSRGGSATLAYTHVRYGGNSTSQMSSEGTLTVSNSTITSSATNGIEVYSGTARITSSTIRDSNASGIQVSGGTLTLSSSTVSQNQSHGIEASGNAILHLTSNTLSANQGQPIHLRYDFTQRPAMPTFTGNTMTSNGANAIGLSGTTGTVTLTPFAALPFVIDQSLNVAAGSTLTLPAGLVLKFQQGSMSAYGRLVVQGTASNPVLFTSLQDDSAGGDTNGDGTRTRPGAGEWYGLYVSRGGSATLAYTHVRYGGGSSSQMSSEGTLTVSNSTITSSATNGIEVYSGTARITSSTIRDSNASGIHVSGGTLTLGSSTVSQNQNHGIEASGNAILHLTSNTLSANPGQPIHLQYGVAQRPTIPTFTGNTMTGNGANAIGLSGTTGTLTLTPFAGLPFVIDQSLNVAAGSTLTLPAGLVLKFQQGSMSAHGRVVTQGTASSPVVFTSLQDDSVGGDTNGDGRRTQPGVGEWYGLYISTGGGATVSYTHMRYGGASPGLLNSAGTLTVSNSTITSSATNGIEVWGGTARIANSTIRDSSANGIQVSGGTVSITNNSIINNQQFGVYNDVPNTVLKAENNWWGSSSGPAPFGAGNAVHHTTIYNERCWCERLDKVLVDADPWIGKSATNGLSIPWHRFVSDPVNTANGNYSYEHTDISISTRSMPLAFARQYNSATATNGPLGYGWTHSFNMSVFKNEADGSVTVSYGDGRTARFVSNGSVYTAPPGTYETLRLSDGRFRLTEKDQTVYAFDIDGRLATVTDRNGNTTTLTYTGILLARVAEPGGRTLALTYDAANRIVRITDALSRAVAFTYNARGDLVTATDPRGKVTTYAYDTAHRMTAITDANGHTFIRNIYNANGRVVKQYDASDNLTTFTYDLITNVTTVRDPRGSTTTYTYDADLRLLSEANGLGESTTYTWDAGNNRTGIRDARGSLTTFTYDPRGNMLTVKNALGGITTRTYDARNNLLTEHDALGRVTSNTYDSRGNLSSVSDALGGVTKLTYYADAVRRGMPATRTDARGNITRFDYDAYGNTIRVENPLGGVGRNTYDVGGRLLAATDALSRTTAFTYDAADHVLTITDPAGGVTTNTFDAVGNQISITDPLGRTTYQTYTNKDQLATTTDAAGKVSSNVYDAVGNRTSMTDGNAHTTTLSYDLANRLVASTDALGKVTKYTYDAAGNRLTVTDPLEHRTSTTYDRLNRPTATRNALNQATTTRYDAVGNPTIVIDALGRSTSYTHDALNRRTSTTDAAGFVTRYEYDVLGNQIKIVDGNGKGTTFSYDADNRLVSTTNALSETTTFAYDGVDNRVKTTNPLGYSTTTDYDVLNRPITTTNALGKSTMTRHDAVGNPISLTDALGRITRYSYDALDRLIRVTDALGKSTRYTYDAVGNQLTTVNANNRTTRYSYDAVNRVVSERDPLNHGPTYTYDVAGRLVQQIDATAATITYTYDNADRLSKITYPEGSVSYTYNAVGARTRMVDSTGTTTYTYDRLDRPVSVAQPTGSVAYAYDAVNLTKMTVPGALAATYTYDAANRLRSVTDWGNRSTQYTYDAAGRMTTTDFPNGVKSTAAYDNSDRLVALEATSPVSSTLLSITYSLDAVGNLIATSEQYLPNRPLTKRYTYDGLNRLVSGTSALGTSTKYTYDAVGNRRTMTRSADLRSIVTSYTYDTADRLNTVTTDGVATPMTWNNKGQLLTNGAISYRWDTAGRLVGLTNGSTAASYTYNGDGVRVGRIVNGAATRYLQDLAGALPQVLVETSGSAEQRYVYGVDRVAQINGTVPNYYHGDALGSVRAMSNASGQSSAKYNYDPFGAVEGTSGGEGNPFMFTGEQVDPEANLIFLRARYYDPTLGRFLSHDPARGEPLRPTTMHPYQYAENNPFRWVDPSGRNIQDWGSNTWNWAKQVGRDNKEFFTQSLDEHIAGTVSWDFAKALPGEFATSTKRFGEVWDIEDAMYSSGDEAFQGGIDAWNGGQKGWAVVDFALGGLVYTGAGATTALKGMYTAPFDLALDGTELGGYTLSGQWQKARDKGGEMLWDKLVDQASGAISNKLFGNYLASPCQSASALCNSVRRHMLENHPFMNLSSNLTGKALDNWAKYLFANRQYNSNWNGGGGGWGPPSSTK